MLIPLLHKWQEVGPLAYPDGHEWMVPTAFGKTRLTLLGYGLTGFLGLNGLWGARGVLFRELNVSGARKEYVGIALLIAAIGGILLATIPPLAGAVVLGSGIAILLLIGAVIGAQFGSRYSVRLKGEQLRVLLSVMVLGVCAKIAYDLIVTPEDLYSIAPLIAH